MPFTETNPDDPKKKEKFSESKPPFPPQDYQYSTRSGARLPDSASFDASRRANIDAESMAITGGTMAGAALLAPEVGTGVAAAGAMTLGVGSIGAGLKAASIGLQHVLGNPNAPKGQEAKDAIWGEFKKQSLFQLGGEAVNLVGFKLFNAARVAAPEWAESERIAKKWGIELTASEKLKSKLGIAIQKWGRSSFVNLGRVEERIQEFHDAANNAVEKTLSDISKIDAVQPKPGQSFESFSHDAMMVGRRNFNNQVEAGYDELAKMVGNAPVDMTEFKHGAANMFTSQQDLVRGAPMTGRASKDFTTIMNEAIGATGKVGAKRPITPDSLPYPLAAARRRALNKIIMDPDSDRDAVAAAKRLIVPLTDAMDQAAAKVSPAAGDYAKAMRIYKKEGEALFEKKLVASLVEKEPEKLAQSMMAHPVEAENVMKTVREFTNWPKAEEAIQLNVMREIVNPGGAPAREVDFMGLSDRIRQNDRVLKAISTTPAAKQGVQNLKEIGDLMKGLPDAAGTGQQAGHIYYMRHTLVNGALAAASFHFVSAGSAAMFLAGDALISRAAYSPAASSAIIAGLKAINSGAAGRGVAQVERGLDIAVHAIDLKSRLEEIAKYAKETAESK